MSALRDVVLEVYDQMEIELKNGSIRAYKVLDARYEDDDIVIDIDVVYNHPVSNIDINITV